MGGGGVRWGGDAVVHPLALAAGVDEAGGAEVGEVAGDFGLRLAEDLDEVADAELLVAQEVEEAEAGGVAEGLEEAFEAEGLPGHGENICVLTDMFKRNKFAFTDMFRRGNGDGIDDGGGEGDGVLRDGLL